MSEITAETLIRAYCAGIFPMADSRDDPRLFWVDPEERGILPLDGFHLPRSLRRTIRRAPFQVTADTAFARVMEGCAEAGPGRQETWINAAILARFQELHRLGLAHSLECWQNGALVGGLYGLALGGAFFGESMFSRATDASKVALAHLVAGLIKGGYRLLDTQFITGHLARFGAIEIPRARYHQLLARALAQPARFQGALGADEALSLLLRQSSTQIS
ncbi:leucyl/phenylalanyl-tRNA--protein transferase [mine drainage metagenome]|uniref:Leucyl/phenylalanyl-tRNA--protein transferase n=1 Tax=mine drainage metagenome TaxID=410659 RepID=A0A1J5QVF4_9ZZZZ